MDNVDRRPSVRFSPDLRLTALAVVGAVLAIGVSFATDSEGRLLLLLAAAVLLGYAATDIVFRPRLTVDASGIRVRSPLAHARLPWPEVEQVRADQRTRYGLRTVTLEIDSGETLIVLSRRALGAAPEDVAGLVRSFDPRAAR